MRSVISNDYLQMVGISVLLLVFVPLVLFAVPPEEIVTGMRATDSATVSLTAPEDVLWVISAVFLLFGLILMLNSFWQRLFSLSETQVTKAYTIAGVSWVAIHLLMSVFRFVALSEGIAVENINQVAPLVVTDLFSPALTVVFVLLVYLAFASSLDTRVNGMAVLTAHELYYKHFNPGRATSR